MKLWKNSKYITKGDIFLVDNKNEKYAGDAIKKGASKIVTELNKDYDIETIKVDCINEYIKNYYDFSNIKIIGVTGTNGKTTTCYLIYQMLKYLNVNTCYIGTIGCYVNDKVFPLDNTTPSIDILYNLINDAINTYNCEVIVMEVSSHALKQDRVHGLLFDIVAVTNITKDHLDYHKTLKDYINSKKKITNMLKNKKICILNKKDKWYKKFLNKENNNYVIGKNIKLKKVNTNLDSTNIIFIDEKLYNIKTSLVGMFNVYNFLMAYKIIKELKYDYNKILENAYLFKAPPGRMEKINYKKNIIFIDYAHTPDAVLKVLKMVNKIHNKGIITIIGCGGNRDKEKRPIMGRIATKYSKYVIFTNDNPRYEDDKLIMHDILKKVKLNYKIIYDRKTAIKEGIKNLNKNNILMILGKGHEDYQEIKGVKYHFSDKEETLKIINDILND